MTAEEIIDRASDIPVVSETARKLTIQLYQPDLHRSELVKTIRCDNILTAKLLRACNSAQVALREPIVSLDQALLLLGDETIFRMVCALGFGSSFNMGPGYATEANGLWTHSLSTGVGAEFLAETQSYSDFLPATAFTAGLLHDIGKTVLSRIMNSKQRADIRAKMDAESISRVAAEKAVLGSDHCEVGSCLLKRWSLPEPIIEAVANHHAPVTQPTVLLSAVVYLANSVAHLSTVTQNREANVARTAKTVAEALRLDLSNVERLITAVQNAMQSTPQLKLAA